MSNKKKKQNSQSQVYDAECILETKKDRNGKTLYLIKWSGWSPKHNTWEPRKNILDNRLIEAYEKKKRNEKKKPIELKKKESSDEEDEEEEEEYDNTSVDYDKLLDVTKTVQYESKDEIKLINSNSPFGEQTGTPEGMNCRQPNKRPIPIEDDKKDNELSDSTEDTNEDGSTAALDDLNESSEFQSDELNDKNDLSQNNQTTNLNDSNSDTLDDAYENNLVIDTTIEDSNSNDNSINELNLNGSLKRKIASTDFNDSLDFNRKSIKCHSDHKQFNQLNQRTDQMIIEKFFDNRINQSTENSFYSELDNGNFNDKNEFNQESNCANKFKSNKPDFLKKKSSLLDLVTVTDVTSNNQTITIRESKSHKFFFKDTKKSANQCL